MAIPVGHQSSVLSPAGITPDRPDAMELRKYFARAAGLPAKSGKYRPHSKYPALPPLH